MAEVGVLNLTIQDNSEQAGKGLDKLAGALGRVKSAVNGFTLKGVSKEVTDLASTINGQKGASTTIKNLANLFNSIQKFSKIKNLNIDITPFQKLREAIGDGLKIGTAGTQLNALRNAMNGEWGDGKGITVMRQMHDVVKEFGEGGDAKKVKDLAGAVDKYSKSVEAMNKVTEAAGDWRLGMAGGNVGKTSSRMKLQLQQFASKAKVESGAEQIKMDLDSLMQPAVEGFEKVESTIQSTRSETTEYFESIKKNTEEVAGTIESTTSKIGDAMKYIADPISYLKDRFRDAELEEDKLVGQILNTVLPTINQISAEEMVVKKNGEMAKEAIDRLIGRLNSVKSTKGFKLADIVNMNTGVSGPKAGSAEESAKTFMQYPEMLDEVERSLEAVESVQNRIVENSEKSKDIIDLSSIPASGMNGPFENAGKEIEYLNDQLTKAKENIKFWEKTYNDVQNRIKYNGANEERTAMLGHAEEGFYSSMEEAENIQNALNGVNEHIQQYTENMRNSAQAMQDVVEETTDDTREIVENTLSAEEEYAIRFEKICEEMREEAQRLQAESKQTEDKFNASTGLSLDKTNAMAEKLTQLDLLNAKLREAQRQYNEFVNTLGAGNSKTIKAGLAIQDLRDKIWQYKEDLEEARNESDKPFFELEETNKIAETVTQLDLLNAKLAEAEQKYNDFANEFGLSNSKTIAAGMEVQNLRNKIDEYKQGMEDAKKKTEDETEATHRLRDAFDRLKSGLEGLFPGLTALLKKFASIAKYRLLRAVLKQITDGFREGVQNVYEYSKAVGSDFAPNMDSAASSLLQMKNTVGAAVTPLVQSLIPVMKSVINVFIDAINYVNQFLALLRGQTSWLRALPATTTAFNKQEKAAKKAGNAVKDLLADWDELNIIQSNTSGAGTGTSTSAAEDYLKMFEEVNTFDSKVKDVLNFIKDNFDDILTIVKDVGLAILAWKVSSAFAGIIGALGSLVGTAIALKLVYDATSFFDKQFLKTGETGWLIGSLLTPAIGGYFVKAILSKVLGGGVGEIAIPLTFMVSATADIMTLLGATDVSALSAESIKLAVLSALKFGVAGGYIARKFLNLGVGKSVLAGASVAAITLGVVVGLKATIGAIDTGEITGETLFADIVSAVLTGAGLAALEWTLNGTFASIVGLGVGGALITLGTTLGVQATVSSIKSGETFSTVVGKAIASLSMGVGGGVMAKFIYGATKTQALGVGAGASLITMGATLAISAVAESIKSEETAQTVIQKAIASLSMGIGGALIAKLVVGAALGTSIAAGAGLALVTLAATIGVTAVVKAEKSNETMDKIKAAALTSLMMGAGSAVLAAALGGSATLFGALGFGITAGVLAIYFAVKASIRKKDVKWGTISLSDEDVQTFVNTKMFNVDIKTAMNLIATRVEATEQEKENIRTKASELLSDMNIVKLGLATDDTYKSMQKQLFGDSLDGEGGLIKQIKDYAESQKTLIKTSFTLVPVVDQTGKVNEEATAEYLKAGLTGWDDVTEYMTTIGEQLSEALKVGVEDGLDGMDDQLILKLTTELSNVQRALTSAQAASAMTGTLLNGLQGMDEPSAKAIMDFYKEQQEELRQKVTSALTEELSSYNSLAAFYRTRGYEGDEEKAKKYEDLAKNLILDWANRIKAGVDSAAAPGRKIIADALMELMELSPDDIKNKKHRVGNMNYLFSSIIEQIYRNQDISADGENAKKLNSMLFNYLYQVAENSFKEGDWEHVKYALDNGIIGFGDLFSEEAINAIKEEFANSTEYGGLIVTLIDAMWNKSKLGNTAETVGEAVGESFASGFNDGFENKGTIDLNSRIPIINEDGSFSTERSFSTNIDGVEVLIPQIVDGVLLTTEEAIQHYLDTGEFLGKFSTPEEANEYAQRLHERQEEYYSHLNGSNTGNYTANSNNFPNAVGIASMGQLAKLGFGTSGSYGNDDEDLANGVETGTKRANATLLEGITNLLEREVTRLMNRPVVANVNLNPTARFGRTVSQSQVEFSYVNGESIP